METTPLQRYIALALICLTGFGNYFCYDSPEGLEKQIEQTMGVQQGDYMTLFSFYSTPNIILCFFGGVLIDQYLGVRLGTVVFLTLLVIGQLSVALGAFTRHFYLMQLGRFIYGLGGESLTVAQNAYVVNWFRGHEMNMVFGFQISVSRGGSFLALNVIHPIYKFLIQYHDDSSALGYTMFIAAMTCVVSLSFAIVLAFFDKKVMGNVNRNPGQTDSDDVRGIREVGKFKPEYWIINIICASFYVTIFPFIALGSKFFQIKWEISQDLANGYASAIYVIAAISCPIIGYMVDRIGRNLIFLVVASTLVVASHMLMALTYIKLWIPVLLLGIGYSIMCSAIWPLIALVVPQHLIGTAYGCTTSIQNLGLALATSVTGRIVDNYGYIDVELFFVLLAGISVIFSIILVLVDNASDGLLNKSAREKKLLDEISE